MLRTAALLSLLLQQSMASRGLVTSTVCICAPKSMSLIRLAASNLKYMWAGHECTQVTSNSVGLTGHCHNTNTPHNVHVAPFMQGFSDTALPYWHDRDTGKPYDWVGLSHQMQALHSCGAGASTSYLVCLMRCSVCRDNSAVATE